jgi:hypothetical protein
MEINSRQKKENELLLNNEMFVDQYKKTNDITYLMEVFTVEILFFSLLTPRSISFNSSHTDFLYIILILSLPIISYISYVLKKSTYSYYFAKICLTILSVQLFVLAFYLLFFSGTIFLLFGKLFLGT